MPSTEVSLILSSRMQLEDDVVPGKITMRPYKIWHRKPGIVVHGVDEIPSISWTFEFAGDASAEPQQVLDNALLSILASRDEIRETIDSYGLRGTVLCRVRPRSESLDVVLRSDLLAELSGCKCGILLSIDNE